MKNKKDFNSESFNEKQSLKCERFKTNIDDWDLSNVYNWDSSNLKKCENFKTNIDGWDLSNIKGDNSRGIEKTEKECVENDSLFKSVLNNVDPLKEINEKNKDYILNLVKYYKDNEEEQLLLNERQYLSLKILFKTYMSKIKFKF